MKIAIAGKGGVGKSSISAWFAEYLSRLGQYVWMVDADTALSLGQAFGYKKEVLPKAVSLQKDLINEYIKPDGSGFLNLNPEVDEVPESLGIEIAPQWPSIVPKFGQKKLLLMGAIDTAGGGCACSSNAFLKVLLAHMVIERDSWVLVDLEAGLEPLGRGTIAHVDCLFLVSEASLRSLETAAEISRMAKSLGLLKQILILNRSEKDLELPENFELPKNIFYLEKLASLEEKQLTTSSVFELNEEDRNKVDKVCSEIYSFVKN